MTQSNAVRSQSASTDSRRAPRERVRIAVTIDLKGRHTAGTIQDLSASGMQLDLEHSFFGPPGCVISVESPQLGNMDCVVRWNKGRRIGVSFLSTAAAAAQVRAYFKFFHRK